MNCELLAKLRSRVSSGVWDRHLAEFPTDDLEISLTQLDLKIAAETDPVIRRGYRTLRDWVSQNLANLFGEHRFRETLLSFQDWPREFALDVLQNGDSIVSLNYSTLLEGLLDHFEVWSPKGGYSAVMKCDLLDDSPMPANRDLRNIDVLKVHGSENFRRSEIFGTHGNIDIDYDVNRHLFPRSAAHTDFGTATDRGAYIIAPSFVKTLHPRLHQLMLEAVARAREARNLIIIGCGIRPEDSHLATILTAFLLRPTAEIGKIVVVDPEAASVSERIDDSLEGAPQRGGMLVEIGRGIEDSIDKVKEFRASA